MLRNHFHPKWVHERDKLSSSILLFQNKETKWVDLGGAYIGPTQNRILRLAKEYGVKTYKVNEQENLVHYIEVSLSSVWSLKHILSQSRHLQVLNPLLLRSPDIRWSHSGSADSSNCDLQYEVCSAEKATLRESAVD